MPCAQNSSISLHSYKYTFNANSGSHLCCALPEIMCSLISAFIIRFRMTLAKEKAEISRMNDRGETIHRNLGAPRFGRLRSIHDTF